MKRMFLSMLLTVATICGWAANENDKLKVKLDIVDFGDSVVVIHSDKEETFVGKDGKFEFELTVEKVETAYLVQPKILRGDMDDPRIFNVPLVGGEEMRVWQTERSRYDVDGTGFYADYHQVDLFNENANKEVMENTEKYRRMLDDASISEEARKKFFNEVLIPSGERCQQKQIDYIKAHPKQEAAIMLLREMDELDKMKEAFMLFDASVREGRMKTLYDKWVSDAEKRAEAEKEEREAAKKQAAGLEAPQFTLNDLNGKPFALSSLRGKYVILDFWGSWCVWCIKGFPKMKEYYAKFSGKFEILGIDCNDTEDKWKEAVKKHELPWLHVYCPRESTLFSDYGITGFPTNIIIGPDGKIVKTGPKELALELEKRGYDWIK